MGGVRMEEAGCQLVANLSEAALMGLAEVVRHLPRLFRLRDRLVRAVGEFHADLIVLVDFPDFNLAFAKAIRRKYRSTIPILYYVSPQVWAWRRGRAKTIARLVDAMAVLFPFEREIYAPYQLETVFFGHPLAGEVKPSGKRSELRKAFGLNASDEVVAILPGSRKQEVERHLPVQLAALELLRSRRSEPIVGLLVCANTVDPGLLRGYVQNIQNVRIVQNAGYDALAVARVAMVKSGTSTLEAALIGTPFVVLYRTSALTFRLARLLVKGVRYIAMVNLLAGREVVKERIQDEVRSDLLVQDLEQIWEGEMRERLIADLTEVSGKLGRPGATRQLAEWICHRFGRGG